MLCSLYVVERLIQTVPHHPVFLGHPVKYYVLLFLGRGRGHCRGSVGLAAGEGGGHRTQNVHGASGEGGAGIVRHATHVSASVVRRLRGPDGRGVRKRPGLVHTVRERPGRVHLV